jgi:nifR3 family TIM-barrel protein
MAQDRRAKLLEALKSNPFVLAPMAGITDHAFRSFMREMNAGVVVTELVSATGLEYKSQRTEALMSFDETQRPVGIQLFGENPEHLANAARMIEEKGADFVDINFGCPVPKVVKKGAGSAMLKDLPAMKIVLRSMVSAVKIPVTIKIRTGWDGQNRNAHEVVQLAHDEGITWVAIHGRTRAQGYEGSADWDYIGEVKAKAALPILGNGDIVTAHQAVSKLKDLGLDGVMIGRGALRNPFIFKESRALLENGQNPDVRARDFSSAFARLQTLVMAHCDDRLLQIQLKKFAAWFCTGYAGAAQFRKNIYQAQSASEVMAAANNFFEIVNQDYNATTSNEGFLMGGHG